MLKKVSTSEAFKKRIHSLRCNNMKIQYTCILPDNHITKLRCSLHTELQYIINQVSGLSTLIIWGKKKSKK